MKIMCSSCINLQSLMFILRFFPFSLSHCSRDLWESSGMNAREFDDVVENNDTIERLKYHFYYKLWGEVSIVVCCCLSSRYRHFHIAKNDWVSQFNPHLKESQCHLNRQRKSKSNNSEWLAMALNSQLTTWNLELMSDVASRKFSFISPRRSSRCKIKLKRKKKNF